MLSRWATGPDLLGIVTGSTEDIERRYGQFGVWEGSDPASRAVFAEVESPFCDGSSRWHAHGEGTGEAIIGCVSLHCPVVST